MAKHVVRKTVKHIKSKPASTAKSSTDRSELNKLLKELNEKEIKWVLAQVKTIIHNHKVAEINAAAHDLQKNKTPAPKPTGVDVVQVGNTKNFNILWDNARLFLNLAELKSLVKIAQSVSDNTDGAGRIYRWFQRERKDIIIAGNISGPGDAHLKKLVTILKEKFSAN